MVRILLNAWYYSRAKDIAQKNGDSDYAKLRVPALKASIKVSHISPWNDLANILQDTDYIAAVCRYPLVTHRSLFDK
jgi:hypothetical protein